MKLVMFTFLFILTLPAYAGLSEEVFITGKVGSEFYENKVKVNDTLGQTFFLERKQFPEGFKFIQGESFAIQVDDQEFEKIEILNKKQGNP